MENFIQKYIKLFNKKNRVCSRKDFWIFILFNFIVFFFLTILVIILDLIYEFGANWDFYYFFTTFLLLSLGLLSIILAIKRFRDIGITPWILLIAFIPYVNILIPILLCLPSSKNKIPTSYIGKK